ncbi:hypothetical protein NQZ79_g4250 [Umbelopsis isabellina]|nr:hypothetical protein NQZ79_g4250 [Umbelopsis isabellina]
MAPRIQWLYASGNAWVPFHHQAALEQLWESGVEYGYVKEPAFQNNRVFVHLAGGLILVVVQLSGHYKIKITSYLFMFSFTRRHNTTCFYLLGESVLSRGELLVMFRKFNVAAPRPSPNLHLELQPLPRRNFERSNALSG